MIRISKILILMFAYFFSFCKHYIDQSNEVIQPTAPVTSLPCLESSTLIGTMTDSCYPVSLWLWGNWTPHLWSYKQDFVPGSARVNTYDNKLYFKLVDARPAFGRFPRIASLDLCTNKLDTSLYIVPTRDFYTGKNGNILYTNTNFDLVITKIGSNIQKIIKTHKLNVNNFQLREDGKEIFYSHTRIDTLQDGTIKYQREYIFADEFGNTKWAYTDTLRNVWTLSPDFSTMITTVNSIESTIILINKENLQEIKRYRIEGKLNIARVSPDNKKIVFTDINAGLHILDLQTGIQTKLRDTKDCEVHSYYYARFTPDSKKIIAERCYHKELSLPEGTIWTQTFIAIMDIDGKNERIINLPQ